MRRIFDYLLFRLHAKNEYGIHSPFVFDLYNQVFKKDSSDLYLINLFSDIKYLLKRKNKINSFEPFSPKIPKRYQPFFYQSHIKTILLPEKDPENQISFQLFSKNTLSNNFILLEKNISSESLISLNEDISIVFFTEDLISEGSISVLKLLINSGKGNTYIFENPHKSKKAFSTWEQITSNEKITLSLDLYFLGISFLDSKFLKQQLTLKM